MKLIEKAWALQHRFEQKPRLKWLDEDFSLLLASVFCMFTGVILFFYVVFTGVSLLLLHVMTNPLTYLILGVFFMFIRFFIRYADKVNERC